MTLNIMIGIPGSGKSKVVSGMKGEDDIIICPDSIRKEITGNISDQSQNKLVWEVAYERLNAADENTWFDATNLSISSINKIINNSKGFDNIRLLIMTSSKNAEMCYRRIQEDLKNGLDRSDVPWEIVDNMQKKFFNLLGEDRLNLRRYMDNFNENQDEVEMNIVMF